MQLGGNNTIGEVNFNGDTLWTKTYNSTNSFPFTKIISAGDSNFLILSGQTRILKINSIGDSLWFKPIANNATVRYYDIAVDSLRNIIAVGETFNMAPASYIVRLDSNGIEDTQFSNTYGTCNSGCTFSNIYIDTQGNYLVGGYDAPVLPPISLLIKISPNRNQLFSRTYNHTYESVRSVSDFINGKYIFTIEQARHTYDTTYIIEVSQAGSQPVYKKFVTKNKGWQGRIIKFHENAIYVCGQGAIRKDTINLMKLDTNYNVLWIKYLPGKESVIRDMKINNNNILLTGYYTDTNARKNIFFTRIDSLGLLTSIDKDANVKTSVEDKSKLVIYPNPLENFVSIKSTKYFKKFEIFNSFGTMIEEEDFRAKKSYKTKSPNNPGLYFIKIHYNDGTHGTIKVIRQ
jgi:hypothetical protein